jgi:hypothetical protein
MVQNQHDTLYDKQVALILRIRRPFSERKLSTVIIENNFDSDYIISHSL